MSHTPELGPGPGAPAEPAVPGPGPRARALGQQVLIYTPDGPLGGTFTCVVCAVQAWQPDLLDHAPACPHRPVAQAGGPERR